MKTLFFLLFFVPSVLLAQAGNWITDASNVRTTGTYMGSALQNLGGLPLGKDSNGQIVLKTQSAAGSSVTLSGTTETLTLSPLTTGTTTIAAGTYSVQLLPSLTATGSIISTGTFAFDGATDALIPIIPGRPGDTNPAITVIVTGTVRRIQR
jgi:hypothetical protein